MKLVYLTLEATRQGSASYTHVNEIIKGLRKRGWEITLYKPPYSDSPVSPGLLGRLLSSLCTQLKLWMQWERGGIIYVRAHYLAFPTALMAKFLRVPIFHEINGPYEDAFITHPYLNKFKKILIWMQRAQFRWASGLIAVTDQLRAYAVKESRDVTSVVIPNGANTDIFTPDAPAAPETLPDKYAVFFGGLAAWHGIDVMMDALACEEWPVSTHMVVIGDGPAIQSLKKGPRKNRDLLHILGKRQYHEIPSYVKNSLCGLIPISDPENRSQTGLFPLKLFETLACGVPVIVTDFPGQADLVRNNKCGIVIPPDNPVALARAVADLAADPQQARELGMAGYKAIQEGHSWDRRADDTDKFIKSVI